MKTSGKKIIIGILVNLIISSSAYATADVLLIRVTKGNYYDETAIRFLPGATYGFDGCCDAWKCFSSNPSAVSVFTDIDSVSHLAINSLPGFTHTTAVDLHVKINSSGNYKFQAFEPGEFLPGVSIVLEDKVTGLHYNFRAGNFISIYLTANTLSTSNRFALHFSYPTKIATTNVSCTGTADGSITLTKPENHDWKYELKNSAGIVVSAGNHINETTTVGGLEQGNYTLITNSATTSVELSQIIIFKSEPITACFVSSTNETTLSNATIQFTNNSVNSTSWLWDFGDKSPVSTEESPCHQFTERKTFTVTLTAKSNNCSDSFTQEIFVKPDSVNGITSSDPEENSLSVFQQSDILVIILKSTIPAHNTLRIYNSIGQEVYGTSAKNSMGLSEKTYLPATGTYFICAYINDQRINRQITYHKNN